MLGNSIKHFTISNRWQNILGWCAVVCTAVFTSLWTFWGIIENFHEGWWYTDMWRNIALMFVQYLALAIVFYVLGIVSVWKQKIGAVIFLVMSVSSFFFFGNGAGRLLASLPLLVLSLLWLFGNPLPRVWVWRVMLWLAPIVLVVSGAEPFWRVVLVGRINDGNFNKRVVEGNGVTLTWAPRGPGFPDSGVSWFRAKEISAHLDSTGVSVLDSAVNIWRLPTVSEAVASLTRHGTNAGGIWNSTSHTAEYVVMPDKETPLWNPHTQIIYWWTSTESDSEKAFRIVYNGQVWPTKKKEYPAYYGFRAVRSK